jgi:hypothetical protein
MKPIMLFRDAVARSPLFFCQSKLFNNIKHCAILKSQKPSIFFPVPRGDRLDREEKASQTTWSRCAPESFWESSIEVFT